MLHISHARWEKDLKINFQKNYCDIIITPLILEHTMITNLGAHIHMGTQVMILLAGGKFNTSRRKLLQNINNPIGKQQTARLL